jgi:chitinase
METPMVNGHHDHHGDTSDYGPDVAQPAARREVIYYLQTKRPLSEVAVLPYTDVIVAFLVPLDTVDFTLGLAEKDDPGMLTAGIGALHAAGKRVLISLGGAKFPSAAYAHYSRDVNALAGQIVGDWVAKYHFDGVDIDYEESEAFYDPTAAAYSGTTFLIGLTRALASQLPPKQRIITHAPQSPYWDPKWRNAGAPYREIWDAVGDDISWVNNQFYNNQHYDDTPTHQKDWYGTIASITDASKLMFGANLYDGTRYGYLTASQLVSEVIQPLRREFPRFGGVMGWELSYDTDGKWGRAVAQALA